MAVLLCAAPAADARRALYAADPVGSRIYGFAVASDGALSWLAGFPLTNQASPKSLTVGAIGTTLFAAASEDARGYVVDPNTSSLTPGATASTGSNPAAMALSPDGSQIYVANAGSDSVSRYKLSVEGSLPASPASTKQIGAGTAPSSVAITPDGRFLYVTDSGAATISAYSIDQVTGDLTELSGSPYGAGSTPTHLIIAPSGRYLYATLKGDDAVAAYGINATAGTLSALTGSPYSAGETGAQPDGIAIAPDGNRLLVANSGNGTVARYTLSAAGIPARRLDDAPVVTGAQAVAISPDGIHAYVGGSSALVTFDLGPDAALNLRGSQLINAALGALVITPNQGPVANATVLAAPATTRSIFNGGASTDSDGLVASWDWDFGDGSTATGLAPTHVYASAGTYTVTLRVADNEGCARAPVYTGQQFLCAPNAAAVWSAQINIPPPPDTTPPDQTCSHDGDDGYCGTPDHKAPRVTVLGVTDGSQINDLDAPTQLVGSIAPDPSGVQSVRLRFSKAAGTVQQKKTVVRRRCRTRRVHGKKRRLCTKRKVVVKTNKRVAICLTISASKNYLVGYRCSKVPWLAVPTADGAFRYDLPVALGTGSYTVDVLAVDGAGNSDVLEKGRNAVSFKVVKTPATTGTGSGSTSGGGTGTTTSPPPISDTGSPFG